MAAFPIPALKAACQLTPTNRPFPPLKIAPATASPKILQKDRPSLVPQQAVCDVLRFPVALNILYAPPFATSRGIFLFLEKILG
jgi:hypothetical protein